jgi:hypothetical protein
MRSVLIASALLRVCAMVSYSYIMSTFSPFKTCLGRMKWCISSSSFTLQQTYYSPKYRGHLPTRDQYKYNYGDDDYDVYGLLLLLPTLEEEKGGKEEGVARDGSGEEGKEEEEDKEEEDDADGGRQQQQQQQQRRRKKRE